MPAYWLSRYEISFPHPEFAEEDGLLALGGDLRPERLVLAYRNGIFPWFEDNGVFAWFSPDPRCVLFPEKLNVHKSMKSIFNQHKFHYTIDQNFEQVMQFCGEKERKGQSGQSWITDHFLEGYSKLHSLGLAHSVEVWQDGNLVGGLYGIAIGKVFCGESMFANVPNASKAGFITLVRALQKAGFWLIDCQQETEHLKSLGAETVPRKDFLDILAKNQHEKSVIGRWYFNEEYELCSNPV